MENENVQVPNGQEVQTEQPLVEETPTDNKVFTQEDVNKIIADRLAREQKKMEAKIQNEIAEAEKLAKMSEAERTKALFEKDRAEFEKQKKEFEDIQLLNQTQTELSQMDLPITLAKYVKGQDAETTKANLEEVQTIMKQWLSKALEGTVKPTVPSSSNVTQGVTYTREQIAQMSPSEINANWDIIKKSL